MPARLNPYLNFNGNAREAMTFYQEVLGGDLTISTFGEYGTEGEGSDGVMHAQLETPDGFTLMASDTAPGMGEVTPGSNFSVSLSGDDDGAARLLAGTVRGRHRRRCHSRSRCGATSSACSPTSFGIPWLVNVGTGSAQG